MRVNAKLYRALRAPRSGRVKVHLGPGQRNYLAGWINVDANLLTAKIDVWADLTGGLPFRDATVDMFYSHHVIEHLPDAALAPLFAEMYRCLKPGGCIRIVRPSGVRVVVSTPSSAGSAHTWRMSLIAAQGIVAADSVVMVLPL